MNKSKIIGRVAERMELHRSGAEGAAEVALEAITEALANDEAARTAGFGAFTPTHVQRGPSGIRAPAKACRFRDSASKVPAFGPGKEFRGIVERGFRTSWAGSRARGGDAPRRQRSASEPASGARLPGRRDHVGSIGLLPGRGRNERKREILGQKSLTKRCIGRRAVFPDVQDLGVRPPRAGCIHNESSNMSRFDDLPKHDRNRAIEDKAEAAFQKLISQSEDFIFQGADRRDYGTDCQIEVIQQNQPTNVRVHVQVKSTEGALQHRWLGQH